MHPDLLKLLDLQSRDQRIAELAGGLAALAAERAALDSALDAARSQLAAAERQAADARKRRDERETKLEGYRTQQEKRKERLEQERNPRIAAQLMADLELTRSIVADEEAEWMRAADDASHRQQAVDQATARLAALEEEQAGAREDLDGRERDAQEVHSTARSERDAAAGELDRVLRTRYDRLRNGRRKDVLIKVAGGTCTACYTAIPRSRIGQLQADGILLDGCEMCGAILYLEAAAS
jgi:predicted  nucleic acid-binding Zn-ribbon protein